jgi:predicted kinase
VYLFPERSPPDDLVVVDCIEFNRRFRYADPICDMAFLSMDLGVHGRRDLAGLFESAYLEASGDAQGAELLPFYRSYRAAVRGKVEGMLASEAEVESGERAAALRRARGHWLYALAELLDPLDRPGVVLVSGLPGAGKSTLARALAERFGFHVISSDRTRKALARLEPDQAAPAELDAGIYTPEWTERTYETCMAELRERLFEGERVAVDATFWSEDRRRMFLDEARAWGVRCSLLEVRASPQVVRQRMDARVDAEPALAGRREARAAVLSSSDADWRIHEAIRARWEAPTPDTGRTLAQVWTDGTRGDPIEAARSALARAGLTGAP